MSKFTDLQSKINAIPFFNPEVDGNISGTFAFKGDATSLSVYGVFFALTIAGCILLWFFRKPFQHYYWNKQKIIGLRKSTFWSIIGWIILLFVIARSVIIYVIGPGSGKLWEIIPFHFCRIMLLFLSLTLIFKRLDWIKYYAFIAVLAAIIAIVIPGIYKNTGLDSFWFWDYVFAHSFIIIMSFVLFLIGRFKYRFQDTLKTLLYAVILAYVMFFINIATFKFAPQMWKSNYWYLGIDSLDEFHIPAKWPWNLTIFIALGIILVTLSILAWVGADKIYVNTIKTVINGKTKTKLEIKIVKSKFWEEYKKSLHEVLAK